MAREAAVIGKLRLGSNVPSHWELLGRGGNLQMSGS